MMSYLEYFNWPSVVVLGFVIVFFVLQLIGELLEFKGKIVPEFLKIRKYFKRKKKERESLSKITEVIDGYKKMSDTLTEVNRLLNDIDKHYSKDNITMRDTWMKEVNEHIVSSESIRKKQDELMTLLNDKIDKNNEDTLSLLIEHKRSSIIDFASKVIDEKYPVTREQFNRIFKTHREYEGIIENNNLTNGEIDIAYRIITEAYENHMKNHTFIEDIRGYDSINKNI